MTHDGGTIGVVHATVETFGENSPALNVHESGGEILAERGSYSTSAQNSPVILSNGSVTVSNAKIEAKSSQAAVLEGEANVQLQSSDVTANSEAASSDQAIMIYREGNGDPLSGTSYFTMNGGNLTSRNGDVFYVSNVNTTITLSDVAINNDDEYGAFLRAGASNWGTTGLNGGKITLYAAKQNIDGNIELDGVSDMNMYLTDNSYFTGAVNTAGTSARIFVSISSSRWTLTDDSHISALNCQAGSINLNGHTLYVNGKAYSAENEYSGRAIDFASDRNSPIETDDSGDSDDDDSDDKHEALPMPATVSDKMRRLILWMMATSIGKRPQSVDGIIAFCGGQSEQTKVKSSTSNVTQADNTAAKQRVAQVAAVHEEENGSIFNMRHILIACAVSCVLCIVGLLMWKTFGSNGDAAEGQEKPVAVDGTKVTMVAVVVKSADRLDYFALGNKGDGQYSVVKEERNFTPAEDQVHPATSSDEETNRLNNIDAIVETIKSHYAAAGIVFIAQRSLAANPSIKNIDSKLTDMNLGGIKYYNPDNFSGDETRMVEEYMNKNYTP